MSASPVARREALGLSVAVLFVLGTIKHLAPFAGGVAVLGFGLADLLFTLAFAFDLYVPVLWVGRSGVGWKTLGLHLEGWRTEFGVLAAASGLTTVLYGGGFLLWSLSVGREPTLRLPPGFLASIPIEIGVVALSEELFFRGLLQERLQTGWPSGPRLFGVPVLPVVGAALVFAVAHFIGDYRVGRLATFFPGLVFGWMRARGGSLVAAVGYHAFCNLLQDALFASVSG